MKHIAAYINEKFANDADFRARVMASPESSRASVWESGVFTREFLELHLDPLAPRTAVMHEAWDELMEALYL